MLTYLTEEILKLHAALERSSEATSREQKKVSELESSYAVLDGAVTQIRNDVSNIPLQINQELTNLFSELGIQSECNHPVSIERLGSNNLSMVITALNFGLIGSKNSHPSSGSVDAVLLGNLCSDSSASLDGGQIQIVPKG